MRKNAVIFVLSCIDLVFGYADYKQNLASEDCKDGDVWRPPALQCIKELCPQRFNEVFDLSGCQRTCNNSRLVKISPVTRIPSLSMDMLMQWYYEAPEQWGYQRVPHNYENRKQVDKFYPPISSTTTKMSRFKMDCLNRDVPSTIPDCVCKKGYLRDDDGWCVRIKDCKKKVRGKKILDAVSKSDEKEEVLDREIDDDGQ